MLKLAADKQIPGLFFAKTKSPKGVAISQNGQTRAIRPTTKWITKEITIAQITVAAV
jgi:hypothetical protein